MPDQLPTDRDPAPPPALEVRGLGVSFRGVRALDGVDLAIPAGGVSAVIGPNGAGKTTLFNCVSGVNRHEGEVLLGGRPLAHLPAHRRAALGLARTFQTPALLQDLTALENVLLGAHTRTRAGMLAAALRLPSARAEERRSREEAWHLLDLLGVAHLAARPVSGLPHGDRRRVEVARALLSRPTVLLLDEPAAGLSSDEAHGLLDAVAGSTAHLTAHPTGDAGEGVPVTCVLVEHDVALVMTVARQVAVLDAGRLVACGTPAEVAADQAVIDAYLGTGDDDLEVADGARDTAPATAAGGAA